MAWKRGRGSENAFWNFWDGIGNILRGDNWTDHGNGTLWNSLGNEINQLSGVESKMNLQDSINDENAEVAQQHALEQMQYQSQLNSVDAKAGQLAAAGLNPALAGGVGNTVGGASAQMSQVSHPHGNSLSDLSGFALQLAQAQNIAMDTKLKEQEFNAELPTIQWLGIQSTATKDLSMAQYYLDLASYERYKLEWERKTEKERLDLVKSEAFRNKTLGAFNKANAQEKALMNSQLDQWVKLLPKQKQADLAKELAEVESIEDKNRREESMFWLKASALVAGGICMFIPGAQGAGVAFLSAGVGLNLMK